MTDEFSQGVLVKVVAQICQMVGYHKIMTSPLHILADLLRLFIRKIGQTAQHYAEHCGRSCLNLSDLSLAFFDSNIKPSDLLEFLKTVGPLPQCLILPKYPIKKYIPTYPATKNETKCSDTKDISKGLVKKIIPLCPIVNEEGTPLSDESQIVHENNNEHEREPLKMRISLSKIKAAAKSKRKKSIKNKKKKKKKRSRT